MPLFQSLPRLVNVCLRLVGARIVRHRPGVMPWDGAFRDWIAKAKKLGVDPNDLGDREWNDDPLREALLNFYLPYIRPDSTVLELGPGTGRLTRHLIGRCREMILVDYSRLVLDWLQGYLRGKGRFHTCRVQSPFMPDVASDSVDVIVANGVFEHMDPDDMAWYLEDFRRVLKPAGVAVFNFENIMSEGGLAWQRRFRGAPGDRCIFRFYHPQAVCRLAEAAGLQVLRLTSSAHRLAFIELQKPPRAPEVRA
jgi:SAM-dependent methyltransferase